MSAVMSDKPMTKEQLADYLEISVRQVERLVHEGLPFTPIGSRSKRFIKQSVDIWLKMREKCLSNKTRKATGISTSVWIEDEYTAACQKGQAGSRRSNLKPSSGSHLKQVK